MTVVYTGSAGSMVRMLPGLMMATGPLASP